MTNIQSSDPFLKLSMGKCVCVCVGAHETRINGASVYCSREGVIRVSVSFSAHKAALFAAFSRPVINHFPPGRSVNP